MSAKSKLMNFRLPYPFMSDRLVLPVSVASFAMPIAPAAKNAFISNTKITEMMMATITMPMFWINCDISGRISSGGISSGLVKYGTKEGSEGTAASRALARIMSATMDVNTIENTKGRQIHKFAFHVLNPFFSRYKVHFLPTESTEYFPSAQCALWSLRLSVLIVDTVNF